MFFPRGGSANVVRALARCLPAHDWEATILSGSLPGHGDAHVFYAGLDVHAAEFEPAGTTPMHPSFEDRPGVADGVFAAIDDAGFERHVRAWAGNLESAGAPDADVLHLHHLTPINEAARRIAPHVPVVAHLHGTELLMLEEIDGGAVSWPHAEAWAQRMRRWARQAHTLVVPSRAQLPRVRSVLGIGEERCVVLSNGVDLDLFDRREVGRRSHWRRQLADEPQGWAPGEQEGSVGYTPEEAERVARHPVVLYVGRFTAVKRLPLLIRAWAQAEPRFGEPASLVLVGGHPDEWEGEHPLEAIAAAGARDVFLAGWHPQEQLPEFLAASDVLVLPSVREQFGMVLPEAMACGIPPIGVNRFGPAEIIDDGQTGWLVEPDDQQALADAIVAAVNEPAERARRGAAAYAASRERYGWGAIAEQLAEVLDDARASDAGLGADRLSLLS